MTHCGGGVSIIARPAQSAELRDDAAAASRQLMAAAAAPFGRVGNRRRDVDGAEYSEGTAPNGNQHRTFFFFFTFGFGFFLRCDGGGAPFLFICFFFRYARRFLFSARF